LFLALKALGIGEGDEVIVPAYGFIAIPNAVRHVGATPVFVDAQQDTLNIDPKKIVITEKTRAIIAVHTYGMPCDMDEIMAFGVPVIEDAAEAHGALYKGRIVGSIGDIGCFSFFANKTITTGEGGMVVTNNPKTAKEVRLLKDQYRGETAYIHEEVGYGMSLGAMQCALGLSQLSRIDEFLEKKRALANRYNNELLPSIIKPNEGEMKHSYWMYPIFCRPGLVERLASHGIETRSGFYPLNLQKPYLGSGTFPVTETIYPQEVCLPMNLSMTDAQQTMIIKQINEYISMYDAWRNFY
jgi:perosamine synthetase